MIDFFRRLKENYGKSEMSVQAGVRSASFDIEVYRARTGRVEKRRVAYYHRNPIRNFIGRLVISIRSALGR